MAIDVGITPEFWVHVRSKNYVVDIQNPISDYYTFCFLRSTCNQTMIDWFAQTWGPEGRESGWWENQYAATHLKIVAKGLEKVTLYRMVWDTT